jgi:hypothetical protein
VHCWTGSGPVTGRALIPGVRSKVLPAPVVAIGTQPNFRSPAMTRASVASESLLVRSPIRGHGREQSMMLAAGSVGAMTSWWQTVQLHTHCWRYRPMRWPFFQACRARAQGAAV